MIAGPMAFGRQDSDLRCRMGEQGERIVRASFSLTQNIRQLLDCYDLSR
jgi:hypothetical protein